MRLALLILLLAAVPAEARPLYYDHWRANSCRYQTFAWACDRVTWQCVRARRCFNNPIWR